MNLPVNPVSPEYAIQLAKNCPRQLAMLDYRLMAKASTKRALRNQKRLMLHALTHALPKGRPV